MEPVSPGVQRLRDAVLARDRGVCRRLMGLAGDRALPVRAILQALTLAAARHVERRFPTPHGLIFVDAVRDLVPTWLDEHPGALLEGALETLLEWDYGPSHPEALLLQDGDRVDVVAVSELDESLVEGDLRAALRAVARLLSVVRSKEAFMENLLVLAAHHVTELGHTLIYTMSAVKGMQDLTGEPVRDVLYGLLSYLASRGIERPGRARGGGEQLPWQDLFERAVDDPGLLDHNIIYLSHAFQACRYAELRRAQVVDGVRGFIASHFPARAAGEDSPAEAGDSEPPPPTGENLRSLDPAAGSELRATLHRGAAAEARRIVRAWWGRVEDPDPLYRWIAEACLLKGDRRETHDLIRLNASRWGAHLMKERGLAITDRMMEHICDLAPREIP